MICSMQGNFDFFLMIFDFFLISIVKIGYISLNTVFACSGLLKEQDQHVC